MYKNSEGYSDPTAGQAMSRMMKEYKQQQKKRYAEKNRKKVYVASPYAGDVETNVRKAIRYCRKVIDAGYMPVANHLMYPAMLDDNNPVERDLGLMFGLALLSLCDEVWVFGPASPGMQQEINEAKRLNKKIVYKGVVI
jgi:hypothetical protein